MSCKLDKILLQDLMEGTIDPVERIFVEEHLKTCTGCRRELTELKLLFWDLNNKVNYEIDMPEELDTIKDAVLKEVCEKNPRRTASVLMEQQRKTLKASGKFLEFVPGVKEGGNIIKEGAKAAPSAIGKASIGLLKGAKMLIAK